MYTQQKTIKTFTLFFFFGAIGSVVAYKSGLFDGEKPVRKVPQSAVTLPAPQSPVTTPVVQENADVPVGLNTDALLAMNSISAAQERFIISSSKSMPLIRFERLDVPPVDYLKPAVPPVPPAYIKRTAPVRQQTAE